MPWFPYVIVLLRGGRLRLCLWRALLMKEARGGWRMVLVAVGFSTRDICNQQADTKQTDLAILTLQVRPACYAADRAYTQRPHTHTRARAHTQGGTSLWPPAAHSTQNPITP